MPAILVVKFSECSFSPFSASAMPAASPFLRIASKSQQHVATDSVMHHVRLLAFAQCQADVDGGIKRIGQFDWH